MASPTPRPTAMATLSCGGPMTAWIRCPGSALADCRACAATLTHPMVSSTRNVTFGGALSIASSGTTDPSRSRMCFSATARRACTAGPALVHNHGYFGTQKGAETALSRCAHAGGPI
eukprot:7388163-Prymnesium_polylepis.2